MPTPICSRWVWTRRTPWRRSDRIKVLHIITGLQNGGAEAALFRLCTAERSHSHFVVSLSGEGKYGPLLREAGISLVCLSMPKGRLSLKGLATLRRIFATYRPDVVQCWMYHANLVGGVLARLFGIKPILWGMHSSGLDPRAAPFATRAVDRICASISGAVPARIVSCSEQASQRHVRAGYSSSKWTIIPNGYDLAVFEPDGKARARLRQGWSIEADRFIIGNVARWHPDKDHKNLVAALSALSARTRLPFQCILVGPGITAENAELVGLLDHHGVRDKVMLLGPRDDIADLMNAFDIHVLASSSEAFPNVIAEAMACGTPCVATDVGDVGLLVGNVGFVVPERDPEALSRSMEIMALEMRDSASWTIRRQASRDRIASRFSLERMAKSYGALWERLSIEDQARHA
ncbi:glycosyltransferase [Mesorhizobium sp. M0152]|uniref:glycosyltransferase family 4 protein n=1 Tax=Mesorhizobium sp. M0152 TaxID=2956898 RepID=UPI00333DD9A7